MAAKLSEDWQGKKSLVECNRYMLEHEISDVTFKITHCIKGKSSPPVHIRALRTLLLSRSSVFYAMFCGELQEQSQLIEVTDVEPAAFKELIRYCYTDEVHLTADNVLALLYASKKYMISALINICAKYLEESLNADTAPTLLDQSIFFDMRDLTDKCMEKVQSNASTVLSSEAFINLSRDAFNEVLKSDNLNATELEVFNASLKWAKNQCKIQETESTAANMRTALEDALYLIRFPTMTMDEFNDDVYPHEILTETENLQVLRYITAKNKPKNLTFITRSRNQLKMEMAAASVVGEKKLLLINSPFQKIPIYIVSSIHTKLQCITSHPIQIHQVLIHADDGWYHVQSCEIKQGARTLFQQQNKHVKVTTSETCQHPHVTAKMQDVAVSKGQFEMDIQVQNSHYNHMKIYTSDVTHMSDDNVTIDINKLTEHNLLLGLQYSVLH